jgi:sec-independent protein translocase protein TatB
VFGIGIQELGLILVVALLVFGPKRMPELARTLGRGLGEFRKASSDLRQSLSLDDLQSDLRRSLDSSQTIHKPALPPDRPAQAGDDLETATPEKSETPETAQAADSATASDPESQHPGELPEGNDHQHHAVPDQETSDRSEEASGDLPKGSASDPERG